MSDQLNSHNNVLLSYRPRLVEAAPAFCPFSTTPRHIHLDEGDLLSSLEVFCVSLMRHVIEQLTPTPPRIPTLLHFSPNLPFVTPLESLTPRYSMVQSAWPYDIDDDLPIAFHFLHHPMACRTG